MSQNHARKNRAKKITAATGAGYASAAAGTAHRHKGPTIPPFDGTPFGEPRTADMAVASALIGACADRCEACQQSGANAMVTGDRLAVLGLAGPPFAVISTIGPVGSSGLAPVAREFVNVAGGPEAWTMIQRLTPLELATLLDQAVNIWSAVGPAMPGITDPESLADELEEDEDDDLVPFAYLSCGYVACVGVSNLVSADDLAALAAFAESKAATADPIKCFVCDQVIDVHVEREVHIGLLRTPGVDMPAWTHRDCASSRVWSEKDLEAERRRHCLRNAAAAAPESAKSTGGRELDWLTTSIAKLDDGIYPLLVVQPGNPHEHGLEGHLAEMLSHGLLPLDLTGAERPTSAASWAVHTERGRLTEISRNGTPWFVQPGGYPTSGDWRGAARTKKTVLLAVAPHGTFSDDGRDLREPLAEAARRGHLLGGLVSRYGTL